MPIECSVIMAQHFHSPTLSVMFNVEGYDDWMIAADATYTYQYHRQVLQVLQSHNPGRWQLMHVKDMKKGTPSDFTGGSDVKNDVAIGSGAMDWPAIL